MAAGIILLIGLMLLVTQLMIQGASGQWPSITLASELALPADRVYSDWMIVNTTLRFFANEVQLWLVLVFASAVTYWLIDFADEQLARLGRRRQPTLAAEALPADAPSAANESPQA